MSFLQAWSNLRFLWDGRKDAMAITELTKQAFKLYDNIKVGRCSATESSQDMMRLYSLERKAFDRYKRRLNAEYVMSVHFDC